MPWPRWDSCRRSCCEFSTWWSCEKRVELCVFVCEWVGDGGRKDVHLIFVYVCVCVCVLCIYVCMYFCVCVCAPGRWRRVPRGLRSELRRQRRTSRLLWRRSRTWRGSCRAGPAWSPKVGHLCDTDRPHAAVIQPCQAIKRSKELQLDLVVLTSIVVLCPVCIHHHHHPPECVCLSVSKKPVAATSQKMESAPAPKPASQKPEHSPKPSRPRKR